MKLKIFFLFFPLILFSQNSFLKDLWIGAKSITNENFSLSLYGVIYQSEESKDRFMDFYSTDFFSTNDLNFYLQKPINMNLGNTVSLEEFNSNFLNNFKTIKGKSPNIFPVLEFLKGKLLTVQNTIGSKSSKDFLFSISFNDKFPPRMIFNLTEELENGEARTYQIPTKIINEDVFLIFSNEILNKLGFECTFSGKKAISIQYSYKGDVNNSWRDCYDFGSKSYRDKEWFHDLGSHKEFMESFGQRDYNYRFFNEDYVLTIEKRKDVFSNQNWLFFPNNSHMNSPSSYLNDNNKFFFLFELIEKD